MSSLLDILHRKDGQTGPDPARDQAADEAAQTVELRLAVDNGPLGTPTDLAVDGPARPTATAGYGNPDPGPAPAADAAVLLTARQLRQRSRRSSTWLGVGLAVIVIGAGLAAWLLNKTTAVTSGNDSLFTAPAPDSPLAPGPNPGAVDRLAATAAKPAVTRRKPPTTVADEADTTWFDAPAVEDAATDNSATATAEPLRFVRATTTNPLFARLSEAWAAFQAADYERAEALYREVRAADATNVDALLGLGALAARGNRTDEARELYQAVLLAEPKNATAISALSTMPATGARNLDESTLKDLLREQPGAANLHFALGLQYVVQGRWPDAQLAFFDAVRNEPTNADYAYNLAVSLDQLGQSGPATAYYQRALDLATASALFNTSVAEERLATLRSPAP